MPANADDFRAALQELRAKAKSESKRAIIVRAGDLHQLVGGYPGPDHRMPVCCRIMREEMKPGDRVLDEPPKGNGASLKISYQIG